MRKTIEQNAAALSSQLLIAFSQLSDGTSAQVRRVAALQSSMPVIGLAEPKPDSESEHTAPTQTVDIMEPLLQQKVNTVRQALQSEVSRAEAAQAALAETNPSLAGQISEAHGEYISRIHVMEEQVSAAAAAHAHIVATMTTDPQSLMLQLAGIERALIAEKTNRAAAEAALSLPRLFAETLQAATAKRVDAYMRRKTTKLTATAFEAWAEMVAFDIMQRRSTAEALASEVIAAEEAAHEMETKMMAAHGARTSALEQEVESLTQQLALANQRLSAVDIAQSSAQERLEAELRREQIAYSEFVATQEEFVATLQQALEAEMAAKELLVEKALSADAVEQEIKVRAQAKFDAGKMVTQQLDWPAAKASVASGNPNPSIGAYPQTKDPHFPESFRDEQELLRSRIEVAVDTFEDGIPQIEGHDQKLSHLLRDSKAATVNHLALKAKARKAAQDKFVLEMVSSGAMAEPEPDCEAMADVRRRDAEEVAPVDVEEGVPPMPGIMPANDSDPRTSSRWCRCLCPAQQYERLHS